MHHDNPGCRCLDCEPGLLQLARLHCRTLQDHKALDQLTDRLKPTVRVSNVVTLTGTPEQACDGTMVCGCPQCTADKQRAAQGAGPSSPFARAA